MRYTLHRNGKQWSIRKETLEHATAELDPSKENLNWQFEGETAVLCPNDDRGEVTWRLRMPDHSWVITQVTPNLQWSALDQDDYVIDQLGKNELITRRGKSLGKLKHISPDAMILDANSKVESPFTFVAVTTSLHCFKRLQQLEASF